MIARLKRLDSFLIFSYVSQVMMIGLSGVVAYLGYLSFMKGEYGWVIWNFFVNLLNIHTILVAMYMRRSYLRRRKATKTASMITPEQVFAAIAALPLNQPLNNACQVGNSEVVPPSPPTSQATQASSTS